MKNPTERQNNVSEEASKPKIEIAEKNDNLKKRVMELLHQYPDHFVPGLFEEVAEKDFDSSDIMVAKINNQVIGCLMFNRKTNQFNWLAISKTIKREKAEIAKQLFENFYPTIERGTFVHFFVNTEDASIPRQDSFSGKKFEPARRLYKSMGLILDDKNIIKDYYGKGAHVYRVEWKIE